MKFKKFVLLITVSLALAACGAKDRSSNNDVPSNPSTSVPSTSVPTEHSTVSGEIGPSGGTVKDPSNNVSINIPAGALSRDTKITATYIDSPEILTSSLSTNFLGAAEFGPDGTVFAKPVSVTINLIKTPKNTSLAVFCYDPQEDVWEYVTEATPSGNKATFEATHFSVYQVMDRTKDFLNEYTNIVNHAQVNGLSDSEIIEAFRDYLVNEKHIMDQYTTFGGYWYEPCGLKINGKYQINGKSGDPEALSHKEGDENKVGNSYGMSTVDGATSNKQGVKAASSSSEVYDITVIVEYKIIKPDIELSASKTKLNKGESATISIRCHYTNAQNFYPEYKDLELADYLLTIKRPSYFTIDKTSVLTNSSGRASFTVTANENNKAETITVNFDVEGKFGVHAEGNVTLNSEGGGYLIQGSISEELTYTHKMGVSTSEDPYTYNPLGTLTISLNYDFSGSFEVTDEGLLSGSLSFDDVDASISATTAIGHYDVMAEGVRTGYSNASLNLSTKINDSTPYEPTYDIEGEVASDNTCYIASSSGSKNIYSADSNGHLFINMVMIFLGEEDELYNEEYDFHVYIDIANSNELLLDFALEEGTHTYNSGEFKDALNVRLDTYGYELDDLTNTKVGSTTQTITVSRG